MPKLARFLQDRSGATAIEYALIVALVAVAVISGLVLLGTQVQIMYHDVAVSVPG